MRRSGVITAGLLLGAAAGCSKIVLSLPSPAKIQARTDFDWIEERTGDGRFQLLIQRGALVGIEKAARENLAHAHLRRCHAFLAEPDRGESYTYVLVKSREELRRLLRVAPQGMAVPEHRMVVGEAAPVLEVSHELFHVISTRYWGRCEPWLAEGMAVACDDAWFNQDLHGLARYLRREGRLVPLKALLANFRRTDTLVAYPEAGSFTKFLLARGGWERMKALWQRGSRDLEAIYGESLASLEEAWHTEVDRAACDGITYSIR